MTTIKDIAEKAGVSIGTVDRVIHNRGRVSSDTRDRVETAIKDLKYKPNIFARQLKLSRKFTFGILMPYPEQDNGYWELPLSGIEKARDELSTHQIEIRPYFFDRYRLDSFLRVSRQIPAAELDGLLIAPVLTSPAKIYIETLPDDLPIVFFDSLIPDVDCLSCIIQDSFQSGLLAARLLKMLVPENSKAVAVRMAPDDYHIHERIRGFEDGFRQPAETRLKIYDYTGHDNPGEIDKLFSRIISENSDLKGVFITNARTFSFARFLNSGQIQDKIHIIGYDLIKENVECLKSGSIDFLISQQSDRQGYQGLYTLFRKIVLNEPVQKKIMMPIDIITKENIDYYDQKQETADE